VSKKEQIPESVDTKLVDAVVLIDQYAKLIWDVGQLAGVEDVGVDITAGNPKIDQCIDWIHWYEEFTGRAWFKDENGDRVDPEMIKWPPINGEMDARLAERCRHPDKG
jgi:hypothetical protein